MRQTKVLLFLFLLFILIFPRFAYSATLLLEEPSTETINDINQEFSVNVKLMIGTSDGTNYYLRGVFYKEGSSQYCGYTWNGSDWFNGPYTSNEGWKKLPSMVIASGSALISLKSRFDPLSSSCSESGNYRFKVQRYTQAGSKTFDDQEPLTVSVSFPTITPTPSKSPTPSKTPSPTKAPWVKPTQKVKTQPTTKQPVTTTASQQIRHLSPAVSVKLNADFLSNESFEAAGLSPVLGAHNDVSPTEFIGDTKNSKDEKGQGVLFVVPIIVAGSVCMGAAAYLSARNIKRRRSGSN